MYNKKCRPEQQWCDCKKRPCKKEQQIAYYPCKEKGNRKCDKYIGKTYGLIEELEFKNQQLAQDLMTAAENQALAGQDLGTIENELAAIVTSLGALIAGLGAAQNAVSNVIDQLVEDVVPYQENATLAINDALLQQEDIEHIIECLEHSFRDTVKCLKGAGGGGCPVLIPEPVCGCECECDCEDEWDDEDDCDCIW